MILFGFAALEVSGVKNSGKFRQALDNLIVDGNEKILADDKVNFLGVSTGRGALAITDITNWKVEDEIDEISVEINLRAQRWCRQFLTNQGVERVFIGDLFEFVGAGRLQIKPG